MSFNLAVMLSETARSSPGRPVALFAGGQLTYRELDAFEERFGLFILEGYGMTETASTITFNPSAAERRAYSVGKPIWGTQTQVWGDDGRPLPAGRPGACRRDRHPRPARDEGIPAQHAADADEPDEPA
jgi:acyl-coenzyme A synthetase/AMP-(fatty) acid ligase